MSNNSNLFESIRLFIFIFSIALSLSSCSTLTTKVSIDKTYKARLVGFKYPFTVSNFKIKSQNLNLEMSYMDTGDKGSKKVAVLLHGKNFSGYYWERIAKDLVTKGYRVVIPDQIGFGKSSKPSNYQFSFPQLALNTNFLLNSLEIDNYILVGHSMGGMLAVTMANLYPKKIEQLVLINPIGLETYLNYVEFKDTNFFYKNELSKTVDKARAYQKRNYYNGKWDERYEQLLEPLKGQLKGGDWELVAWNNALTYGPIFSEDLIPRIKTLKVKTKLIIGTRDRTGPGRKWKRVGVNYDLGRYDQFGKRFKLLLPTATIYELEALGHMPQFEDYKLFSKIFFPLF